MNNNLINAIHTAIMAMKKCNETNNPYAEIWMEKLGQYEKTLPSGSGIDNGTSIDLDKSTDNKIVLHTAFHHMDEYGYYEVWSQHDIIVTPVFGGIDIRITGKDRNMIKEYLSDVFYNALSEIVK